MADGALQPASDVFQDWQNAVDDFNRRQTELDARKAPLQARVDAFEAEKPKGILEKLSRAFNKVAVINPKKRKIRKIEQQKQDNLTQLQEKARGIYVAAGDVAISQMPDGDVYRDKIAYMQQTQDMVDETERMVNRAIRRCWGAGAGEVLDAVTDNKGIDLVSYFITAGAAEAVNDAGHALANLQTHLKNAPVIDRNIAGDIAGSNEWDFFADLLNENMGNFTSILNISKLTDAVVSLKQAKKNLTNVEENLQTNMMAIRMTAIETCERGDARLNTLMHAVFGYLPPAITDKYQPQPLPAPENKPLPANENEALPPPKPKFGLGE